MPDERDLIREAARRLLATDKKLAEEMNKMRGMTRAPELTATIKNVQERVSVLETAGIDSDLALETIVNRVGRPVLEIADDDFRIEGPEATIWESRLGQSTVRASIRRVIPSVGCIEVDHHPDNPSFLGTGWLIADDIVVTNRHVAQEFSALSIAAGGRSSFQFKRGFPDRTTRMTSRIDFRRELKNSNPRTFSVKDVLHIEDDDGPDFAFLRVERSGSAGALSPALAVASGKADAQQFVATVGYPASDSRIPEHELMSRLFGDKYNVKRLAPGQVQKLSDDLLMHDCTTLGGNSGSPIVDLTTGQVLGLHFSGVFLKENRGVPIGYVTSRLAKVLNTVVAVPIANTPPTPATQQAESSNATASSMNLAVPLQITVTLGGMNPSP